MPDADRTITTLLERAAASGRTRVSPVEPSEIRHRAARRTTMRLAGAGAVTAVAVFLAGSTTFDGGGRSNSLPADPASPLPTVTQTTGKIFVETDMLLTPGEVEGALGTAWQTGPVRSDLVTPCQDHDAPGGDTTAMVMRGGWSSDDALGQLLVQADDAYTAQAAYNRALSWFTECGGVGVDQSDSEGSLARRFAADPGAPGVDEARVVVRMRERLGSGRWTNTVAAVVRVRNAVAVLAWDVTIDDNPGVYDDAFLGLVRVLASQLTGAAAPATADQALLAADHPAVVAVLGEDINDQMTAGTFIDVTQGICFQGPSTDRPSGVVAAKNTFLVNEKTAKIVNHSVMTFASEAEAADALDASLPRDPVCKDDGETRTVEVLDVTGGAESYGYEVVSNTCCVPVERRFVFASRVGSSVLRLIVESKDGLELDRGEMLDLYDAAVARLRSAS